MTKSGNKISGLAKERVREQLADEADPKAIKRLAAAREYLDGLSPAEIENKYGWNEQTIYGWLNRFGGSSNSPWETATSLLVRRYEQHSGQHSKR
jgi:uncharacterized protein YjcR